MPESFGARLRRRREEQRIALIRIAEQTKIKVSLLEALERDDVSHWPAGIFRRAFIRAYARAIGLDPDVVVREFLEVHPEPSEDLAMISAAAAEEAGAEGRNAGPPTRLRYIVGSAIESLARLRRGSAVEHRGAGSPVEASQRATSDPLSDVPPPSGAETLQLTIDEVVERPPFDARSVSEADPPAVLHQDLAECLDEEVTTARVESTTGPVEVSASPEAGHVDARDAAPAAAPLEEPPPSGPDFMSLAHLCTEFARVQTTDDLQAALGQTARILNATGLIVWVWDGTPEELIPALVHGYSDKVLAQLPPVKRDADNATAAAFRAGQTCVLKGGDHTSGALAVPLPTPHGCAGVLAIELQHGAESAAPVHAAATIVAAMLAQLGSGSRRAEPPPEEITPVPSPAASTTPAIRKVRG